MVGLIFRAEIRPEIKMTGTRLIKAVCALFAATILAAALLTGTASPSGAASRIKDVTNFEGIRDNLLVGYGLVVGLNNTGDTLRDGVVAVFEFDQRGDPAVEPDPAAVLDVAKDEGLPVLKHQ